MGPVTFSIIGDTGFRAQFFLRIAAALPDRFEVNGPLVRGVARDQARETIRADRASVQAH